VSVHLLGEFSLVEGSHNDIAIELLNLRGADWEAQEESHGHFFSLSECVNTAIK
jgi:hypothetical protein